MEEDIKEAIEYLEKRLSLLHRNYQFATEHAIEILIKGYRELEEKNRRKIIGRIDEIKIEDLEDVLKPYYIPKSKIKEKIDKLSQEFEFFSGREHSEWQDGEFDGDVCDDIALKIQVLQELMEEK